MQTTSLRSLPVPLGFTRTGSRAARVCTFALEMWSRLLVDGPQMAADERARELAWIAENMCALSGVRLSVRGAWPKTPSLLVANHVSYLDPMIISSLVPCTAVAKREVASWPCIGDFGRRLGILFVDRDRPLSGARVLREMMRMFERGVSVLIFPEGTTTHGVRVLPFQRGSFGVAQRAGVPIVPVALHYASTADAWVGDDAFLPHYLRTISKPYTRVGVEILPQLEHAPSTPAEALAEAARQAIAQKLTLARRNAVAHVSPFADAFACASA